MAETLELVKSKENAHSGSVMTVGFNKDGDNIVSGGSEGTLKVWAAGETATLPLPPPNN